MRKPLLLPMPSETTKGTSRIEPLSSLSSDLRSSFLLSSLWLAKHQDRKAEMASQNASGVISAIQWRTELHIRDLLNSWL